MQYNPYWEDFTEKQFTAAEIDGVLSKRVIELETTKWAAPIVFAAKGDGSLCFCVVYRKLSAVVVSKSYPRPRIDECKDSLEEATVFAALGASSGCRQKGIDKGVRDKTMCTAYYEL